MASYSWRLLPSESGWNVVEPARQTADLAEASLFLPSGAYTTLRTYGGIGLIRLDKHFDRLEKSAALLGHPVQVERPSLRRLLCALLRPLDWQESPETRLRLTVDCSDRPGELWLSVEPLPLPSPTTYQEGVAALTRTMHRDNPLAKDSAFIANSQEARALIKGRINEVLMVDPEGKILEGISSNFFGVRQGTLYTAEEGVLPGVTRSLILAEAEQAGIPLRLQAIPVQALAALEEAFISSSGRGILPVVEIDGRPVGAGRPGPLTRRLMERFEARLQQEIERLCE